MKYTYTITKIKKILGMRSPLTCLYLIVNYVFKIFDQNKLMYKVIHHELYTKCYDIVISCSNINLQQFYRFLMSDIFNHFNGN